MTRTRIAPSPTGYPHIGTAYQSLFDFVYARKERSGKFILRIEDTDKKRFVEGAEKVIYDSLSWLKLNPDESPLVGGDFGPYKQSERLHLYQKYALDLVAQNNAYYCFCTAERLEEVRKEKEKNHLPPMYDGKCKKLDPKEVEQKLKDSTPHVIRMKIPENQEIIVNDLIRGEVKFNSQVLDDQVLIKSDGFPTYHLAVVVDDHLMEITHVIRGEEWLSSAPKHVLLYKYFNWKEPIWTHLPLLRNPDKGKISKRMGHSSIFWYKDQGYLPEALLNFIALTIWGRDKGKEIFSVQDMVSQFDFKKIRIASPTLDLVKMDWINGVYIRNLSAEDLKERLINFDPKIKELDEKILDKIIPFIQDRLKKLSEFWDLADYFFKKPQNSKDNIIGLILAESKLGKVETAKNLGAVCNINPTSWNAPEIEKEIHKAQEKSQTLPRQFFMPLRIALSGKTQTPPLANIIEIIGKAEYQERIEGVKKLLEE